MNNILRSVALLTSFIVPASSYGVDFCDPAYVLSQIDSLKSKNSFKSCKIQDIQKNSYDTSSKLFNLLSSLKQDYLKLFNGDSDNGSNGGDDQAISMSGNDLASIAQEIEDFSQLDVSTIDGLNKLKEQAVVIYSSLDTLKDNIITLKQSSATATQSQDECEVDFQEEKLLKLRNKIIKCVDKLKEQSESTTDESGRSE